MITAIILPDAVESIGPNAFRDRAELHTINLPANLKRFWFSSSGYSEAFRECTELYNLIIPENLTEIQFQSDTTYARDFRGCRKLPLKTCARLEELGYKGDF